MTKKNENSDKSKVSGGTPCYLSKFKDVRHSRCEGYEKVTEYYPRGGDFAATCNINYFTADELLAISKDMR